MHEIMGNTLGSLYTWPRGLLRRRRWKLGVTVRNFFLLSNSPNFGVALRISSHLNVEEQDCDKMNPAFDTNGELDTSATQTL